MSSGSLIRATPPCARISAGTRSNAMTAEAPASSAIRACSALTTSQITPPLSISGKLRLICIVPVCFCMGMYLLGDMWDMTFVLHFIIPRGGPLQQSGERSASQDSGEEYENQVNRNCHPELQRRICVGKSTRIMSTDSGSTSRQHQLYSILRW